MRILWAFVPILLAGCAPNAMPKEAVAVIEVIGAMVEDQGVLERFTSNLDVNVQNPGVEGYFRAEFSSGIRVAGTNGEMDLRTEGGATQLPKGVREALIAELSNPNTTVERRDAIMVILGWNRQPVPPGQ